MASHRPTQTSSTRQTSRSGSRNTRPTQSRLGHSIATSVGQASASVLARVFDLIRSSRIALVVLILAILLVVGTLFDFIANYGKAYSGVSVGGVDISGLSVDEIELRVAEQYADRISSAGVTIYANQDAYNDRVSDFDYAYGEEISVEEEREHRQAWTTDSASLQAYIDYDRLKEEALQIGRGGPLDRLALFVSKRDIPVPLNFNEAIVEALCHEIDLSIGKPLLNFGIEIVDGYAAVTEGYDGDMVNRATFKEKLSEQLLSTDTDNRAFVVETEHTPVQISKESAQETADHIARVIQNGILFDCEGRQWLADAQTLGSWIQTATSKLNDGTYVISPSFSLQAARTGVLEHIQPQYRTGEGHVRFAKIQGEIYLRATSEGTFPMVGEALEKLNVSLFSSEGTQESSTEPLLVELGTAEIPDQMSLDEALAFGIISPISEFETEYTTGAFERNTNIHLAADLISGSIVPAEGGEWSFNETAGECNAEKGFLEARAVAGDELIDEIGGGICQVATTVFNAVYEAGYPVTERHNHSIYFSSYPAGRDAAISWPSPDLKWVNDSPSDVLLVMSYTDSTVKATLYGEDMEYEVETIQGEPVEGLPFTTVYEIDDSLYPGAEYVRTVGQDGHSITITRNVYNKSHELVRSDQFLSVYSPQNNVIVRGPQT